MNKEEALKKFIDNIYLNGSDLILSNEDIRRLSNFFKEVINDEEKFDSFFSDNENKISKLKSGKLEMQKQHNQKKALQPGVLSECNYVETLAKIFGLNKCVDLERVYYKDIPKECIQYIRTSATTCSSGRYLYYNPSKNIYLFQYGNPDSGDAEIVIAGNKIRLEFKERIAKAGEYDITGLYDESGKLLITEAFQNNTPELIPFIEQFNEETNVIEQIGHNYNNFDEETKISSIQEYFLRHGIDVLVTSTDKDELIALTPDCINIELEDGRKFISTDNSEIRTSGRNYCKIFTNSFFDETLAKMNAEDLGDGKYKVCLNNDLVEVVKGRGTNELSRVKFNKVFFIKLENTTFTKANNSIIFDRKNVMQLKPSISMHMKVIASKQDLKDYYES